VVGPHCGASQTSKLQALAKALQGQGSGCRGVCGHEVLASIHRRGIAACECRDGIQNLVILPLYPQFSISTSGSSLRLLEHLFKNDPVLQTLKHYGDSLLVPEARLCGGNGGPDRGQAGQV